MPEVNMMLLMAEKDFDKRLEGFTAYHKLAGRDKALEYYATCLFAQDDAFCDTIIGVDAWEEAEIAEYIPGGKNDLGVDGLLFSPDSDKIVVIQTKYSAKKWNESNLNDAITVIISDFKILFDEDNVKNNGNKRLLALMNDADFWNSNKRISLNIVTNQRIGDLQSVFQRVERESQGFPWPNDAGEIQIFGSTELESKEVAYRVSLSGETLGEEHFKISSSSFFEISKPYKTLVAVVKGNELADLFNKKNVNYRLFNSNIRSALATGTINPKIKETAQNPDTAADFFYFNNGISATCSSYELKNNEVTAYDLQVINGAQTVSSIADALSKNKNPDVLVLIRLIETGEKYRNKSDFGDLITRYQNTQNPIKEYDFFSNDNIQVWIEKTLPEKWSGKGDGQFIEKFWYRRKRGLAQPSKYPGKIIDIQALGKLRYAFLHGAPKVYSSPKSLWSTDKKDGFYNKAFGRIGERDGYIPASSWNEEEQAEVVWAIQTWLRIRSEAKVAIQIEGSLSEKTYLTFMATWVTSLVAVGVRKRIELQEFTSFKQIMSAKKNYETASVELIAEARLILKREMSAASLKSAKIREAVSESEEIWKSAVEEITARASLIYNRTN